jgi:hypothetical protein
MVRKTGMAYPTGRKSKRRSDRINMVLAGVGIGIQPGCGNGKLGTEKHLYPALLLSTLHFPFLSFLNSQVSLRT